VADNKKINRNLRRLQKVKTWQLVILLMLMIFVSATFLRLNNIGMIQRRDAVLAADSQGDDEITRDRLYDLQRYVSSHMNTDIGKGIYLEAAYKRDVQKTYEEAAKETNPNGNIYKKAQEVCMPQFTSWSYAFVQCSVSELAKYPAADYLTSSVSLPKVDAYRHNFVSPVWSADFAGWSVLVSVVILLMILIRITAVGLLKLLLHRHYKSI